MKRSDVGKSFLFISTHDYRSPRKANVHFIARELAKRGPSKFFSPGFSALSLRKRDPRTTLWSRANRVENHEGVECFLWRTPLHPVNLRRRWLSTAESLAFKTYRLLAPSLLKSWAIDSDTIVVESGFGIAFVSLLAKWNPDATIIYLCSDALHTISCAEFLRTELLRVLKDFDWICAPSSKLSNEFPKGSPFYIVPHGMDELPPTNGPSPLGPGTHLISVGSMLFDPLFFKIAADAFPSYTFHIIGGGKQSEFLTQKNIVNHGELEFEKTIPFLRNACVGIAPYRGSDISPYLVDTSMKLMQYGALGLPAVCPSVAAGLVRGRFGYTPGDRLSIESAIKSAIEFGRFEGQPFLSWSEVTNRILDPKLRSASA